MPWHTQLPFTIILTGAVFFLMAIFLPQLPVLGLIGAVMVAGGLVVQLITGDQRAKALRAQLRADQGLRLTHAQATALLENQAVQMSDGRQVRLRFHSTRRLELAEV